MKKFARVFDLEDAQVLVTVSFNSEDDKYELRSRTDYDGLEVSIAAGFKEEVDAENALESYTLERAIDFRKRMIEMIEASDEE